MKSIIKKAIAFATIKHQGQLYGGQPFMVHPTETAKVLRSLLPLRKDTNLIAAAYLHDTLEDTATTYEELVEEFNEDIASLVKEVTNDGSNVFPCLKTQRGVILKFADRFCNLSHMENWSSARQEKYMFIKSKFWKGGK